MASVTTAPAAPAAPAAPEVCADKEARKGCDVVVEEVAALVKYLEEPHPRDAPRCVRDLIIVLLGPSASGKTTHARHAAASLGKELIEVYPDDKTDDIRQILRRARSGSVVLLEGIDAMAVSAWSTERTDAKVIATAITWLPIFKDLRIRRVKATRAAEFRRSPAGECQQAMTLARGSCLDIDASRSYDVLHAIAKGERSGTFDDPGSALEAVHRVAASLTDLRGMAMLAAAACIVDVGGQHSSDNSGGHWRGAYLYEAACVAARRQGYSPWGLTSRRP
jgi:hypothetical protein